MSDPTPPESWRSRLAVSPTLLHRFALALLPATVVVGVVSSMLWGENGLNARAALKAQLQHDQEALARTHIENRRLLRQIDLMGKDPVVLERIIAEELRWSSTGTTLYVFESQPGSP